MAIPQDPSQMSKTVQRSQGSLRQSSRRNLIGMLDDVFIGDFIKISCGGVTAVGFVSHKTKRKAGLSLLDPNSTIGTGTLIGNDYKCGTSGIRDRTYQLQRFKEYEILARASELTKRDQKSVDEEPGKEIREKLKDSSIGDIIALYNPESPKVAVAGYIHYQKEGSVLLSHIDPNSELQGRALAFQNYTTRGRLTGMNHAEFNLKKFLFYKVLESRNHSQGENRSDDNRVSEIITES